MSEELKLKPCPFCGGRAAFRGGTGAILAGCPYCNIHTIYGYPSENAARIWNSRPAEDAKIARIAELEAERDRLREALKEIVMLSTVDQVCNNCRHCQKLRNMDWCAWYCNAVDDSSTQGCRKFEMADFHNSDVHTIARKALKGAENDQV